MPFARGVASRRSHTWSASCTLPSSRYTSISLSLLAPRARQRLPRLEPCLLPQNHDLEALKVVELPSAHELRARLGGLAVGPLLLDLLVVPQLLQSSVTSGERNLGDHNAWRGTTLEASLEKPSTRTRRWSMIWAIAASLPAYWPFLKRTTRPLSTNLQLLAVTDASPILPVLYGPKVVSWSSVVAVVVPH